MDTRNDIRNVAIIAHVDHGKTTLVDQLLRQSGVFRSNEEVEERVMDCNDLERERGITILSKNTSVMYKDIKINIVDTPGHADFGGEVERILTMVDGVLLLVDAFEGCMPQTRFVLKKALALGKKPIVVVNKIDRPGARPAEVVDEVLDLFIELGANDNQLDFPVVYTSGRDGYAVNDPEEKGVDMKPLFDAILKYIPVPKGELNGPAQVLFSNIDYDDYVGRIGIGRVERGQINVGQMMTLCHRDGTTHTERVTKLYQFEGLKRVDAETAKMGDIVAVSGMPDLNIGETACDPEHLDMLPFVKIDEPTVSMMFMVNNSPFAGREGKFVTSRNLRDRLAREIQTNVALRVEETDSADTFKVSGRGELHLSILIEEMRRQGYEFQVSSPTVIYKEINGKRCEPMELLMIEVPDDYVGPVMEKLGSRKAELVNMGTRDTGITHMEFRIPARGLMGYRQEFLTDTNGNGIMNSVFDSYEPYKGEIVVRNTGSLVAFENGTTTGYGLWYAQDRGRLFIGPGVEVYEGMIVGSNPKNEDIAVNVCKKKHVTNTRAAGSDEALKLTPPDNLSLEQCLEFIQDDELLEVTPKSLRMRKKILNKEQRMKNLSKKK
ncbi:translational GTPase TypA [Caproicibacterium lactatifermentans]|jgi:GTP-binding protein|uniref:Large ribosomal subunit assembly factor BipA n=1 Tax=Caproicibacterium lactatifermentans TaxID=2666138 RepID=A0A859DQ68_9FIRM|nr:translational GTPase TypA [Caproicibacterium lactatifermentans]ARP50545.1 GTP-binding protein TypA [Ruminococcaceae bacterium CPB6]QKN23734.1 translational GTPase TypA [Caproicibacterium lactatifermentans]QKO29631.1 translational GTPase TypA [Caproicibacterium lactatifermentans]